MEIIKHPIELMLLEDYLKMVDIVIELYGLGISKIEFIELIDEFNEYGVLDDQDVLETVQCLQLETMLVSDLRKIICAYEFLKDIHEERRLSTRN